MSVSIGLPDPRDATTSAQSRRAPCTGRRLPRAALTFDFSAKLLELIVMRVLNCVFLLAAFAATASATAIDDEISKLETTLAQLKVIKAAEENNNEALKFVSAAAMASSSNGSGSSSSTVTAGDTSDNSEFNIEPQPTRASTEAPSAASASISSTTSSTTSSGSVEAATSASAASASASASSSASTVVPSALALASAVIYTML
ncbi:hypothetical protein V7S43_011022 [Phytophthora oleae]|uniref:RxLR effector protein n=1 Tax=Phytophthora oleae TaxID=2107226 RepID=A0ABD3FB69_9STRA